MIINYDVNNKGGGGNSFSLENLGYKTFNENDWFDEGEVVIHDNQLFQFTTGHCGEWSDSDAYPVTVEELIENAGNAEGCVRYDDYQSLTDEQKQQACLNIGLGKLVLIEVEDFDHVPNSYYSDIESYYEEFNRVQITVVLSMGFSGTTYKSYHSIYHSQSFGGGGDPISIVLILQGDDGLHKLTFHNSSYVEYATHEVIGGGDIAAVLYDQAQTLTDAQKQQARTNIGAASMSDTVGWVGYDMEQMLTASQQQRARSNIGAEAPRNGKTYGRRDWEWVEIEAGGEAVQSDWNETDSTDPAFIKNKPAIPQPENHQLLKAALSEPMGCQADTWQTLCELSVPESGAYQVSASARMLPADQSTAYKTATVSIEAGTDAAGYTEVMEMTLPRSGEYGTMSVPVNATAGQKLRLRAISDANFYAQASPSAGKASATFIAAVRIGATYQAQ